MRQRIQQDIFSLSGSNWSDVSRQVLIEALDSVTCVSEKMYISYMAGLC